MRRVRHLAPGMVVSVGGEGKQSTISSIARLDGHDGRPRAFIGGENKTAIAIKLEFEDHEPIIAHPDWLV